MTTTDTIADSQISALRNEAGSAGDLEMVATCDSARRECVRAIRDAKAQR